MSAYIPPGIDPYTLELRKTALERHRARRRWRRLLITLNVMFWSAFAALYLYQVIK